MRAARQIAVGGLPGQRRRRQVRELQEVFSVGAAPSDFPTSQGVQGDTKFNRELHPAHSVRAADRLNDSAQGVGGLGHRIVLDRVSVL